MPRFRMVAWALKLAILLQKRDGDDEAGAVEATPGGTEPGVERKKKKKKKSLAPEPAA